MQIVMFQAGPFDSLAHDEQIVAEKLGLYEYSSKPQDDINSNVQIALMRAELDKSRERGIRLEEQLKKLKPREHFTSGGCGCGGTEGMESSKCTCQRKAKKCNDDDLSGLDSLLDNRKVLLMLLFIMFVFCIMQYFSHQSEMKEMRSVLRSVLVQHQANAIKT